MLAYIGAAAAYMHGEEWLEQLLDYIKGNIDFTENYLREIYISVKALELHLSDMDS